MEQAATNERREQTTSRSITPEALAAAYLPAIHRFAIMVSPEGVDPEDVVQDAMVTAIRRLPDYSPLRGSLESWLWKIVVSRAADAGRMAKRRDLLVERLLGWAPAEATAASAEDAALRNVRDANLILAVRRLPRRYRTLLALRFGAGWSWSDIGAALGLSRVAVAKSTRRALDRLRRDLEVFEP